MNQRVAVNTLPWWVHPRGLSDWECDIGKGRCDSGVLTCTLRFMAGTRCCTCFRVSSVWLLHKTQPVFSPHLIPPTLVAITNVLNRVYTLSVPLTKWVKAEKIWTFISHQQHFSVKRGKFQHFKTSLGTLLRLALYLCK